MERDYKHYYFIIRGETGYAKAVYTLNKLCEDYINPTYANSARNPGYVEGSSCEIIDTAETAYPLTWENTYTNGNNGFPYKDMLYITDSNQIGITGSGFTWLASRSLDIGQSLSTDSSYSRFGVVYRYNGGGHYSEGLYCSYSDGSVLSYSYSNGVRPIISLKSGIKITGGEGTSTSPYTISID